MFWTILEAVLTYPFIFYFEILKNVSILIKNLTLFIYGKEED